MRSYLTRIGALSAAGLLVSALTMCAHDASPTNSNATQSPGSQSDEAAARAAIASTPLAHVASRDLQGRARFLLAGASAKGDESVALTVGSETAARLHLERQSSLLGVSGEAAKTTAVLNSRTLDNGGSLVQFGQRVNGIEVFQARASVLLDSAKNLVSISSNLHPATPTALSAKSSFVRSPESALAAAYEGTYGVSLGGQGVRATGMRGEDIHTYSIATPQGSPRVLEATARQVYFPEKGNLVPAHYVEFQSRLPVSNQNDGYAYVISAKDGRVLYKAPLVAFDGFQYRVWAETDPALNYIPLDGPYQDDTPHTSGPNKLKVPFVAPSLITMNGFNHNPQGVADPWLTSDKKVSFGNNVHAYSDRNDQHVFDDAGNDIGNGFDQGVDLEATTTGTQTFDRVFDVTKEPNVNNDQIEAAVTDMFYVTNWLHDYWYDSGFNEAAGIAQVSNFGRGGVEGDPLLAEGQDGADFGQLNNANMNTPSDGMSPRMQMYVWSALPNRQITASPSIAFTDADFLGAATFGPQTFDVPATKVVMADPPIACNASDPTKGVINNAAAVKGNIVVINRGTCAFTVKEDAAQAAGAVGVLLLNNAPGHVAPSPGVPDPNNPTVPLLGLSYEDGQLLTQAMTANPGAVTVHMVRGPETPKHDGTIDNSVIAHEWGHYLHHRLVLCGSRRDDKTGNYVGDCGGMSEGWADFDALMMVIREKDLDPATGGIDGKVYPLAQYATAGLLSNNMYFGIRRAPYSTDMSVDPFTFKHISSSNPLPTGAPLAPAGTQMSEVHNIGEIWAATLFDGYANLLKAGHNASPPRSFQDTKRALSKYLVAGMQNTPVEPNFTEQRDAILSAIWSGGNKADFDAFTAAFAKRGMGVGAVSPPPESLDDTEVVESFDNKGELSVAADVSVADDGTSCDHDGVLDAGETGTITLNLRNVGWKNLANSTVTVTSTDANLTFGSAATVASLDPYTTAKVTIPITAAKGVTQISLADLTITFANAAAHTPSNTATYKLRYNYDDVPNTSATDDVESPSPVWVYGHGAAKAYNAWQRQGDATAHWWHVDDVAATSDEDLVSPDLVVGQDDFKISFNHRFDFEVGPPPSNNGPNVDYDGGVIEISTDGGATWDDISKYGDPGYNATLYTDATGTNIIKGRRAFGAQSAGYPNTWQPVTINLAKSLAGKTVKLRFREGSDESGSGAGWDIDNIAFTGITNKPFSTQVTDRGTCNAGIPDAGGPADAAPNKITMSDDSGCAVTPGRGSNPATATGIGLFGALAMLLRRRRNKK